jgi:hypothetical protein
VILVFLTPVHPPIRVLSPIASNVSKQRTHFSLPYVLNCRIKEILVAQNAAATARQGPLGRFSELLGLYQALSLVVPMQPDLEIDTELQVELLTVQAAFAQMVADRSSGEHPIPYYTIGPRPDTDPLDL